MNANERLSGVWVPLLTPFDAELRPDMTRLQSFSRAIIADGADGLVLFGTTGEFPSLSTDEKIAMLDAVVVAGIDPQRLLVGVGSCALTSTIRLIRAAQERGCRQVLLLPPFYFSNADTEGLLDFHRRVIDAVASRPLDVYLYNIPQFTRARLEPEHVAQLHLEYAEVIHGLKESAGDEAFLAAVRERCPELRLFVSSERRLLDGPGAHAAGCISATANANAAAIRRLLDARDGGGAVSRELVDAVFPFRAVLEGFPMIPSLKAIIAKRLDDPQWAVPRPPLSALGTDARARLFEQLSRRGNMREPVG